MLSKFRNHVIPVTWQYFLVCQFNKPDLTWVIPVCMSVLCPLRLLIWACHHLHAVVDLGTITPWCIWSIRKQKKRKRETHINNKTFIKRVQLSEYLPNNWWQRSMLICISEGAHLSLPALSDIFHRHSNLYFIQLCILCTYTYMVRDLIDFFFFFALKK